VTLQRVLSAANYSNSEESETDVVQKICGSVVNFVTEKHDLDALRLYLFQAIRRVTCQSYGMQACLH